MCFLELCLSISLVLEPPTDAGVVRPIPTTVVSSEPSDHPLTSQEIKDLDFPYWVHYEFSLLESDSLRDREDATEALYWESLERITPWLPEGPYPPETSMRLKIIKAQKYFRSAFNPDLIVTWEALKEALEAEWLRKFEYIPDSIWWP